MRRRRIDRRPITIITTTWTIRWWDGKAWVEQTLTPSIEVVSSVEEASSLGKPQSDGSADAQSPPPPPGIGPSAPSKESEP